jgi:hypothetical protein
VPQLCRNCSAKAGKSRRREPPGFSGKVASLLRSVLVSDRQSGGLAGIIIGPARDALVGQAYLALGPATDHPTLALGDARRISITFSMLSCI